MDCVLCSLHWDDGTAYLITLHLNLRRLLLLILLHAAWFSCVLSKSIKTLWRNSLVIYCYLNLFVRTTFIKSLAAPVGKMTESCKNSLTQFAGHLLLSKFIKSLAAPVGKMNRILWSDWLPERAIWCPGLPALIPRLKKIELELSS